MARFRTDFIASGRSTHAGSGSQGTGSAVNFAALSGSINGVTEWETLKTSCATLGTDCGKRVVEIDARIGAPVSVSYTHLRAHET